MTNTTIAFGKLSIRQINGLYSLNDLHKASGGEERHKPKYWAANKQTQELVAEISKGGITPLVKKHGGRNCGTYACRELVVAYAAWIRPDFHLKVLRVFLAQQQDQQPQLPLQPTQDVELLAQRIAEAAIAHLQKPRESVNEQVERLAKQLSAPNGYPIDVFMPLWEVMNEKMNKTPWLWAGYIRNKDNNFRAQMLTDLLFACNERLWELANLAETHVLVNPKTLK